MRTICGHKIHLNSKLVKLAAKVFKKPGLRGFVTPLGVHTVVDPAHPYFNEHIHHETVHLQQVERVGGWAKFLWQYARESMAHGYEENRFEVEARLVAAIRNADGMKGFIS